MLTACPSASFLFAAEVYENLIKTGAGGTLDNAFGILAWSFNCLMSGRWPSRDWNGKLPLVSI